MPKAQGRRSASKAAANNKKTTAKKITKTATSVPEVDYVMLAAEVAKVMKAGDASLSASTTHPPATAASSTTEPSVTELHQSSHTMGHIGDLFPGVVCSTDFAPLTQEATSLIRSSLAPTTVIAYQRSIQKLAAWLGKPIQLPISPATICNFAWIKLRT
ncbi:uncharacterized protein LOC117115502 [Anneissia japonica]|uniref:uncharacterized protein LOC117115502 n=1 Tax=Anneissia japonica TaxID=1529436 RepID=UPI0014258D79|nr:uncharacterized protein LOC117115502 [Anneissia japonica]